MTEGKEVYDPASEPPRTLTIAPPDRLLIRRVIDFAHQAMKLVVSDDASRAGASQQLREVATLAALVEKSRKERTAPLDREKADLMRGYRPAEEELADARRALDKQISTYDNEQEQRRRVEQARLDREAEKERAKLQKAAERAAAKGDIAKAVQLDSQAQTTVAPTLPSIPRDEGVFRRTDWKFAIIPEREHEVPREFCRPDEATIRKYVNAMKDRAQIPGVRIWPEETTIVRRLQ